MTKLSIESPSGANLAALFDESPGSHRAVVMAHGLGSHKGSTFYAQLAPRLVEKGISCLRVDLYGHGESTGDFEKLTPSKAVQDLVAAVRYLFTKGYSRIGLVGSSFGGNAALLAAAQLPDTAALVLRAPVSDYASLWRERLSAKELEEWRTTGKRHYGSFEGRNYQLGYCYYEDSVSLEEYVKAETVSVPTLLLHGTADDVVPIAQSRKLAKHLPNCELIELDSANHRLDGPNNAFETAVTLSAEFLGARV
ncbi:hypothetical protein AUJ14_04085 [Candidatus Micrarchaeota archaeon CG1_02_55_22]|nr:MAG: hypothetical protein AUJ14_04085 [Candidatus Micrarchaeota archaeon CG1_02_55_22]